MNLDARARHAAIGFRRATDDWARSTPEGLEFERFDRLRNARQRNARIRAVAVALSLAILAIFVASRAFPRAERTAAPLPRNGRIVFVRFDPESDEPVAFSIDPDGTDSAQMFFSGFFSGHSEWPHWSPDGTEVAVFCCSDGVAAHLVDPASGEVRELPAEDPGRLEQHCGFAWSPDGRLLACGNFGLTDPDETGIWVIRASDGGEGRQLTSNPGHEDDVGDFSPDGQRLVFVRLDEDERPAGLFVVGVDGRGLRRITPEGMILELFGGSWSPIGDRILFAARADRQHRPAIWQVNADGSGLHPVPIAPACGGPISDPASIGCSYPGWSPDGTKFVFTLVTEDGKESNIAIANADGSGVVQVTHSGDADQADWGTHPTVGNG
jgi:Tol biopolymer transport system component